MAARVSKDNFEAEVLQAEIPVLVEFYSDSCIPCKQMSPILGDIEDDYENQLKVVKVNGNFDAELAEQYSVMVSPTILFFKGGEEVERVRGLIKKPELEEIVKNIFRRSYTMKVTVAGNVKDIKEGTTIAQLVIDEKVENPEYVTVTVNDEFVENHDLANVTLKENDVVEFLYFMGGGSF